jgi:hypothetical protein
LGLALGSKAGSIDSQQIAEADGGPDVHPRGLIFLAAADGGGGVRTSGDPLGEDEHGFDGFDGAGAGIDQTGDEGLHVGGTIFMDLPPVFFIFGGHGQDGSQQVGFLAGRGV